MADPQKISQDVPKSPPTIVVLPKAGDWDWFPPEDPEDDQSESSQVQSLFAYQPPTEPTTTVAPIEPVATTVRPDYARYLRQLFETQWAHWRDKSVAAVVVLPLLVSTGVLSRLVLNREVASGQESQQPSLSRSASAAPRPLEPVKEFSPQPVATLRVVKPTPARSADDNPRTRSQTSTTSDTRTAIRPVNVFPANSVRTAPATTSSRRAPVLATRALVVSQASVAPSLSLNLARLNAPPAPVPGPTPRGNSVAPAASRRTPMSDRASIESLLRRYRAAFAALDVNEVEALWPTVNAKVVGQAFDQLQTQKFEFDNCQIDLDGDRANAMCRGTAKFVPAVGSRNLRVESRRWTFRLIRAGDAWTIERVESRE